MKLAVLAAAAAAAAASASPVEKRELGGILMCTGANATDKCEYRVYEMQKCHQLRKPFYHNISTFAPDGDDFTCFPRATDCGAICTSPTGCTFGGVDFGYPNKYNLSVIGWNTMFSSFECHMGVHSGGVSYGR